jgi:very-short-patch-repair endonuclease
LGKLAVVPRWRTDFNTKAMSTRGEVLVAIVNNKRDFAIVQNQCWYRIPVSSANKWLKDRWPPQWLAFYQTKVFGAEAHSVNYYTRVVQIRKAYRWQLFPNEILNEKSNRRYYQLVLNPLQKLPKPIRSRRWRRIVFIPTTWQKFINATEINDLYDESPLEDRLWAEFKRHRILAERQEFVTVKKQNYALDFAIYCAKGSIDVETDGDTWHANPEKAAQDNRRDNALEAVGWKVLRFTTHQIREETEAYCIRTVTETINNLDGVDEGGMVPRRIDLEAAGAYQLGLFDDF